MGLKSTISTDPEAVDLRNKLMEAVSEAQCSDEDVLHELAAALSCGAVFSKLWTVEDTTSAVATLYAVAEEVEELKMLNPFTGSDLTSLPEA